MDAQVANDAVLAQTGYNVVAVFRTLASQFARKSGESYADGDVSVALAFAEAAACVRCICDEAELAKEPYNYGAMSAKC